MKTKIMLIVLVLIIGVLIMLKFINKGDIDDKTPSNGDQIEANTNIGIVREQTLDDLLFGETSLIYDNGESRFMTTIKNNGSINIHVGSINITFKDKDDRKIVSILGYIGADIKPNESRVLTSLVDQDLRHATKVEYDLIP
jgi:hypothetical protein